MDACCPLLISTTFDRAIRKKKMTSEKKLHMVAVTYKYGFKIGNGRSVFCKFLLLKAKKSNLKIKNRR